MKTISTAMMTHLSGEVTSLCSCWKIIRTDGVSFYFTDLDSDILYGGNVYSSASGYQRSASSSDSTIAVDNMSVQGILDSDVLSYEDMKNGLFDYATVEIFALNFLDLTQGQINFRKGTFGELSVLPTGTFVTEIRGLTQPLQQEFGNIWSPLCRADFGDSKCGVPMTAQAWTAGTQVQRFGYMSPSYASINLLTSTTDARAQAVFLCVSSGTTGTTEPDWNFEIDNTATPIGPNSQATSNVLSDRQFIIEEGLQGIAAPTSFAFPVQAALGQQTSRTTDGSAIFVAVNPLRRIGYVASSTDKRTFTPTANLYVPSTWVTNTATMTFANALNAGASFSISDGVIEITVNLQRAYSGHYIALAAQDVMNEINNAAGVAGCEIVASIGAYPTVVVLTNNRAGAQGLINTHGFTSLDVEIVGFQSGYMTGGLITWINGNNGGRAMEVKAYSASGPCELFLAMYYDIQPGDKFWYQPGCDKRRETCYNKFSNMFNFRGEPDIPGIDALTNYPDA